MDLTLRRRLPLIAIGLAALAFLALGGLRLLSFETVTAQRAALDAFVGAHFGLAFVGVTLAMFLGAAFSLPSSAALTLAAGYLLGPVWGALAIVPAMTLGATALFLAARTSFGDLMRARAGSALERFEAGFRADGFNYLLALRFFPGAPFFLVNIAAGLIGMKLRDFLLATVIGVTPITIVLASVGHSLRAALDAGAAVNPVGAVTELVFSPTVLLPLLGLTALALAPIAFKRFVRG